MKLDSIIRKHLKEAKDRCDFKKAFIPKGWACIKIKKFSKELAKEIKNVGRKKEIRKSKNG